MQKKILIHLSYSIWPMYGFELDLIQQKLNEGHIVKILHCDGSPSFCSANNSKIISNKKIKLVCNYCKSKFYNGLNWLDNKKNLIVDSFDLLYANQKKIILEFNDLLKKKDHLDEEILYFLRNINCQLENICRTTLMTETRNAIINYGKKEVFNFFKIIAKSTIESHYSSLNHLEKFNPDEIYIFNGRIYRYQPLLRLAQSRMKSENIKVYEFPLYEYENMYLTKKNYPHDLKNLSDQLYEFNLINNVNFLEKEKIAKKWIEDRISKRNHEKDFYPWKNKQISGMLPKNFNKLNFNITYFQTSEFEFLGISENEAGLEFKNNFDNIVKLLNCLKSKPNVFLNIKMHPYKGNDSQILIEKLSHLKKDHPNIRLILPDSTVDSFELIKNSDLVVVMSSMTGIEAAYFKKNVISLTNSAYINFKATKKIKNFDELNLLLKKCITNKNFEDFPSDEDKYTGAVNYIYADLNNIFKSKFLIKNRYKSETMFKNNEYYQIKSSLLNMCVYKLYCFVRFFLKKINIYV